MSDEHVSRHVVDDTSSYAQLHATATAEYDDLTIETREMRGQTLDYGMRSRVVARVEGPKSQVEEFRREVVGSLSRSQPDEPVAADRGADILEGGV